MSIAIDMRPVAATLYFLPLETRVPLKFGTETLTSVTCARACVRVKDVAGRTAEGWGETPLSVQWVWPSPVAYALRHDAMKRFTTLLARAWAGFDARGHPMEIGHDFSEQVLPRLLKEFNESNPGTLEPMPWLAALLCCSVFDQAIHDAFGLLVQRPVYATYGPEFMKRDLADYLTPAEGSMVNFRGRHPRDFFVSEPPRQLAAWHLVGGVDPLDESELTGREPQDGYPVLLADWIRRDGLKCLKIKLRGNDAAWDFSRMVRAGRIACEQGVEWLTADFNCTVREPAYVNDILDRLHSDEPRIHGMILYVEQPFAYELEEHRLDVRSVASRKPLFLDESAHDWRLVRLGRELGWNGVALKTCKTQTGALLSGCWAKAHGMSLMVQDLTNPMLAQIPHVLLAAHIGTIMGVETNAMQFYPDASRPEEAVHPRIYRRRNGRVDLSSIRGAGFGYRLVEIQRTLPSPAAVYGATE